MAREQRQPTTFVRRRDERGQVLVLVVLGLALVLVASAAIVDYGRALLAQRRLQSSADAAALAGAQSLPNAGAAVKSSARYGAKGLNKPRDVETSSIQESVTTTCSDGSTECKTPDTIVVHDSGDVGSLFAQLVGIDSFHVHAEAAACRGCPTTPQTTTAPCPTGESAISSSFDSTPIPAGRTIWFTSVLTASGVSPPRTIRFSGQTITLAGQTVTVPGGVVTFSPTATSNTTLYDPASETWETTVPAGTTGDIFLSAVAVPVTTALPGSTGPVAWQGTFATTDVAPGITWHWGAAVYTSLTTSYGDVQVTPVGNADPAGTPENFTQYLAAGARG